jgi:hypothetical protein
MSDILTKKDRLKLFEDNIVIDKKLLKWRRAEKELEKTSVGNTNNPISNQTTFLVMNEPNADLDSFSLEQQVRLNDIDSNVDAGTRWLPLYEVAEGVSFDKLASLGIKDLTRMIAENKLKFVIGGYGSLGNTNNNRNIQISEVFFENSDPKPISDKKNTFFNNVIKKINNIFKKGEHKYEFDALKFFSLVKLSSKDSVSTYRDRVSDYLKAIHNAVTCGQTALLEDLLRGMVTNKYEAVLFAEQLYYVVNENQMVDFIKKCEKGIKLDYIKNFSRPLPQNVVDKINKINELEVFDNYVVLYYDPEGKVYKETAYEEAKRRDPIIFGVIAGSKKLYYVADWIDEYCDLTLDAFVDALGIEKDDLHFDAEEIKKAKLEKEEKPKNKKRKRNRK